MDHAKEREGVVKYVFQHEPTRITPPPGFADLLVWRTRLRARQLIGADSDGLGYGNLSVRLYASPRFLISASQTERPGAGGPAPASPR